MAPVKKSKLILLAAIVLAVVAGGAFFFIERGNESGESGSFLGAVVSRIFDASDTVESSDNEEMASIGQQTYVNEEYGFSFQYPGRFNTDEFDEDIGETILVQDVTSSQNFQIYVIPYPEPGPITFERIKEDLPDLYIEQPQEASLGDGTPALAFFTRDPAFGQMREVWFVRDERLYQVTTLAEWDGWLSKIMATWRFE